MILLLTSFLWARSNTGQYPGTKTFSILAVIICLTIIYSLAHRFTQALLFQARLQFTVDILLVTWLVWTSDVVNSPYTALYIVIIATASMFLGPRGAMVTSVGCAVAFTSCALAAISGFGDYPATETLEDPLSRTIQSIGFFDITFFIVGLLSARLAERQSSPTSA